MKKTIQLTLMCGIAATAWGQQKTEFTTKDLLGDERKVYDLDGDGWCDLWCAMFPEVEHRNRKADTDGDGVSDYDEMLLWRNPMVEGPPPRKLTRAERQAARQRAQERRAAALERWRERKKKLRERGKEARLAERIERGEGVSQQKKERLRLRRQRLRAKAARLRQEAPERKRRLEELARKHNTQPIVEREDGRRAQLVGELGNSPLFIESNNIVAAAGISADELWPASAAPWASGSSGLNLTGQGQTLGMWEVDGAVRTGHIELTGRVTQKDAAALDTTNHASNVAGAMAGSGAGTVLGFPNIGRGPAYEANVFAYDTQFFSAEIADAAAGVGGDPPVLAGNHSWGSRAGWERRDVDPTSGVNEQWVWYGQLPLGFYSPSNNGGFGSADVDRFLHEDAPHHLMVYAAGNDRLQGPQSSPGTYYLDSGDGVTFFPVDATAFPQDWDDGDEGGYDTLDAPGTAKNVLTVGACEDIYGVDGTGSVIFGFSPTGNNVLAPFSGTGPTDDGRIKPDLVAVGTGNDPLRNFLGLVSGGQPLDLISPGAATDTAYNSVAGTSFAAPGISGLLGQILQRREQLYPGLNDSDPWLGSTLKALAIAGCDDVGAEGPDYTFGHGPGNALRSVSFVDADYALGRGSLIKELTLDPGETISFVCTYDGGGDLAAVLTWSDPAGPNVPQAEDSQNPVLVNNLDLQLEHVETGALYHPWVLNPDLNGETAAARSAPATRGVDDRNNVERVSALMPPPGDYRVTLTHSGGLPGNPAPSTQDLSLILDGLIPELACIAKVEYVAGANDALLTMDNDPGAYYEVETSTDLQSWTPEATTRIEKASGNALIVNTGTNDTRRFWRLRRSK